jgi:hypothetical protein
MNNKTSIILEGVILRLHCVWTDSQKHINYCQCPDYHKFSCISPCNVNNSLPPARKQDQHILHTEWIYILYSNWTKMPNSKKSKRKLAQ